MRPYVANYINTLTKQRQERVSDLLEEARVGKEQLSVLADRIAEQFSDFAPVVLNSISQESRIEVVQMEQNVRQLDLRIRDLFGLINLISLLLESHASVLASDTKAIEDELIALEKIAFNYAFLLSDSQAYSYSHLEPFSDENGRDNDITIFSDRGSLTSFGPDELARVSTDEGVLVLPESQRGANHTLIGNVVAGNSTAFTISDSGLHNAFKPGMTTGWQRVIASAGPVRAPMEGNGRNGAQVLVEFTLTSPSVSSKIHLAPFADLPMEILRITTYADNNDRQGHTLLSKPHRLEKPFSIQFPARKVARFEVLLCQPVYQRVARFENASEKRYETILRSYHEQKYHEALGKLYTLKYEHQWIKATNKRNKKAFPKPKKKPKLKRPVGSQHARKHKKTKVKISRPKRIPTAEILRQIAKQNAVLERMIEQLAWDTRQNDAGSLTGDLGNAMLAPKLIDQMGTNRVTHTGFEYYYTIGLHRASIGSNQPGFKGVFISEPMSAEGDIGEVRLKTSEQNYDLPSSDRASATITSVEYSVSNQANPVEETDWRPILPVGTRQVLAERLFVGTNGLAELRFPADPDATLRVYKNGYEFVATPDSYRKDSMGAVFALFLPPDTYQDADVFTVDYYPIQSRDHTTIRFADTINDYGDVPLVASYDRNGAGEWFASTGDRNTIDLSHVPFVNDKLIGTPGYEPITVRLEDGRIAGNLTGTGQDLSKVSGPIGYYYIQSGNTLMFNKPITVPFRVHYQYLKNNVRVRVVLRANSVDFATPKVDYYHLKAKSRQVS